MSADDAVFPPPLSEEAFGVEFDVMMARAGITIPPDRRPGILAQAADLRTQIALLYTAQPATLEPSNVFRVVPHRGPKA